MSANGENLEERFSALEKRLRALEDRADLTELIARYGPIVDSGEGQLLEQLWSPNGVYEIGEEFRVSGEQIRTITEFAQHQTYLSSGCAHLLTSPSINIDGDVAHAVNHSFVVVRAGKEWIVDRASANEWHCERTERGWRVAVRRNMLLDGDAAARALLTHPRML